MQGSGLTVFRQDDSGMKPGMGVSMVEFTHIQNEKAQMVDINGKGEVVHEAVAAGKIYLPAGHTHCNT